MKVPVIVGLFVMLASGQIVFGEDKSDDQNFVFLHKPPSILPDFSKWEKTWGEFVEEVSPSVPLHYQYEFFVNPSRGATYEIVCFRIITGGKSIEVKPVDDSDSDLDVPPGKIDEFLVWNCFGEKPRVFHIRKKRSAKWLWIKFTYGWEEYESGTVTYKQSVGKVIYLFNVHRHLLNLRDSK